MATNHKFKPRPKYFYVTLDHLQDYVSRGEIIVKNFDTRPQLSTFLTQQVNEDILESLKLKVMG